MSTQPPLTLPNRPPWPSYPENSGFDHVEYEFEMLEFTADWLQRHTATADRLMRNAMVESFAIHVRNLIQFLELDPRSLPRGDDLRVENYVKDLAVWRDARDSRQSFDYPAEAGRANKRVAHLTKVRTDETAGKGRSTAVVLPLRRQEIVLFRHLKDEFRSGLPRTVTTLVQALVAPHLSTTSSSSSVSVSSLSTGEATLVRSS